MPGLRDCQAEAINAAREALKSHDRARLQGAAGSGKSVVISAILKPAMGKAARRGVFPETKTEL